MKNYRLAIVAILIVTLNSCGNPGTGPDLGNGDGELTHTVIVDTNPSQTGTITPSSDSTYADGSVIEFEASSTVEYSFTHWSGDIDSTSENPLPLIVDRDYNLTANFVLKSYELLVTTEGEGEVSEEVVQPKTTDYEHGTVVALTANPVQGWRFVKWEGDITGSDNPMHITVDTSKAVTAVFEKKNYQLTVTTEGEGEVSEEVVQPKTTDYEHGTVVALTANPAQGWRFVKWQGDITGSDNPMQITVDTSKAVTAVFEKKTFKLTVSIDGQGEVTQLPDREEYEFNSTVELQAHPELGWEFVEYTGDAAGEESQTVIIMNASKSVTAVFKSNFYLAENGVTVKCPDAEVGDSGIVNGIVYTKRTADQITTENAESTCTSSITNMDDLFRDADSFNGDISSWDVGRVTSMESMFYNAKSFNGNINSWNVSNVTSMASMFKGATSFNQDLNNWDVSGVATMHSMFYDAKVFNGNISNWDVSSVTTMNYMFALAESFNGELNSWDVSNVEFMVDMFALAKSFDRDLNNWDVSSVLNMTGMFIEAESFNGNISSWDVSSVVNMGYMFDEASSFNGDLSNWDVSNVSVIANMFAEANSFTGDISSWDVSNVVDFSGMFYKSESFNGNISNWDVSSATDMEFMFQGAKKFNQDLSGWCVSNFVAEPANFSNLSPLEDKHKPVWGTCPK